MTEHNPALCAKVARVMGLMVAQSAAMEGLVYIDNERGWAPFRPDTDPADRSRVHDWVRAQGRRVEYATLRNGDIEVSILRDDDVMGYELGDDIIAVRTGPTDAIALCNAVVAMGGEDGIA